MPGQKESAGKSGPPRPPNIFKAVFTALGIVLVVGAGVLHYNTVSVTTSSVSLWLIITRNGQEVPPDKIRSVKYLLSPQPPQSFQDSKATTMRQAEVCTGANGDYWSWTLVGINRFERIGAFPLQTVEGGLYIRSLSLRVEFSDGKIFFLSLPFVVDPHPGSDKSGGPVYVDFSDPVQEASSPSSP